MVGYNSANTYGGGMSNIKSKNIGIHGASSIAYMIYGYGELRDNI